MRVGNILTHTAKIIMANSRIFAVSDLHVDYKDNLQFVNSWSSSEYQHDILLVAGDVTDNLALLDGVLKSLVKKFKDVFYVPGNHELWIRSKESGQDSISKFHQILKICDSINVQYKPRVIQTASGQVHVVPLFSWYSKPEDDPEDSLYRKPPPHIKENARYGESIWMDNHLCVWSKLPYGQTPSMYFSALNEPHLHCYEGHVISFSHFLPRWDLIPMTPTEENEVKKERSRLGLEALPQLQGGVAGFNFSRYAGSKTLDKQIRKIGAIIHVYGHQHRNRDRMIDNVRYVSHCLGNPTEQKNGWVWGIHKWNGPKQVWPADDNK